MAYFGKIEYAATGEGIRIYYVFSSTQNKSDFILKCIESGISNYFVEGGDYYEVSEIPLHDLEFIEKNLPRMHRIIKEKIYEKGWIWIKYEDYMNFS